MQSFINEEGRIVVISTTITENYALKCWMGNNYIDSVKVEFYGIEEKKEDNILPVQKEVNPEDIPF